MPWDFNADWDSPMDPSAVMAQDRARNKEFETRQWGDCPLPGGYTKPEQEPKDE